MIHNKYHHNNRHSRAACVVGASAPYNHGVPLAGAGGNPVRESKALLNGWIPAFAGMTKIFIAIYMLTPLVLTKSAQAAELGRLFFTPEQRAQLEQKRTRNATAAIRNATAAIHNATDEEESSTSVLTVNGIVQKKGGARTVWINGVAQNAGNSDEHSPEALPVSVPGQSRPVKLKVGQKLILDQPAQKEPPASAPQKKQPADDD